MTVDDLALLSRRERLRLAALVAILVAVAAWASIALVQPGPPRKIVLASGPEAGVYHRFARRYVELLEREGVTVEERMTGGAADNLRLLEDRNPVSTSRCCRQASRPRPLPMGSSCSQASITSRSGSSTAAPRR